MSTLDVLEDIAMEIVDVLLEQQGQGDVIPLETLDAAINSDDAYCLAIYGDVAIMMLETFLNIPSLKEPL